MGAKERDSGTRFGVKLASHYVPVGDFLDLARHVESIGYESVWTTEGRTACDSVTTAAAIAACTERVRIGTSVVNPYSRSPALLAVSAASIDQISRGRFTLGIGPGDPVVLARQGIRYRQPLTRLREYVHVVRELLAGKSVSFAGETVLLSDLELDARPYGGPIPVYIGATGPRALEQANEIGDGILLNVCVPRPAVEQVLAHRTRCVRISWPRWATPRSVVRGFATTPAAWTRCWSCRHSAIRD